MAFINVKTLSLDQLLALVQAGSILVNAGVLVGSQIAGYLKSLGGDTLSEAQLNAICDLIIADATRRKGLAVAAALDPTPSV